MTVADWGSTLIRTCLRRQFPAIRGKNRGNSLDLCCDKVFGGRKTSKLNLLLQNSLKNQNRDSLC